MAHPGQLTSRTETTTVTTYRLGGFLGTLTIEPGIRPQVTITKGAGPSDTLVRRVMDPDELGAIAEILLAMQSDLTPTKDDARHE